MKNLLVKEIIDINFPELGHSSTLIRGPKWPSESKVKQGNSQIHYNQNDRDNIERLKEFLYKHISTVQKQKVGYNLKIH